MYTPIHILVRGRVVIETGDLFPPMVSQPTKLLVSGFVQTRFHHLLARCLYWICVVEAMHKYIFESKGVKERGER